MSEAGVSAADAEQDLAHIAADIAVISRRRMRGGRPRDGFANSSSVR
jgi:hypothetical protein